MLSAVPVTRDYLPCDDQPGASLYYERAGSGPRLVLIHGNMLDRRIWDFNWLELARRFEVVRYDMRGFGRSGPASRAYGGAIADLHRLITALGDEPVAVCGTSMGGVVALHFALMYPERTRALVLADTDLSGYPVSAEFADPILRTHQALSEGDRVRAAEIWLDHPMLLPVRRHERAYKLLQRVIADYSWRDWMQGKAYLIDPPAVKRLDEIDAPTLLLVGQDDLARFHAIADQLHRGIGHSRRVTLPGASHLPNMEQPDRFNTELCAFLCGACQ